MCADKQTLFRWEWMLASRSVGTSANVKNIGSRFGIRYDLDGSLTQMMKRKNQCSSARVFPDAE
jgi:hypothetical protein